jgi:hypothetical protein
MASTIVVIAVILKTQDNAGFIGIKTDESLNRFMERRCRWIVSYAYKVADRTVA